MQEIVPTQIAAPSDTTDTLAASGESHWFAFESEPGRLLRYQRDGQRGRHRAQWRAHNLDFNNSSELSWFSTNAEEVVLQVTSSGDDQVSGLEYQLSVDVDVPELIELDGNEAGRLRSDQPDWYQFSAVQGATYRIETSLISLEDSVLELFEPAGQRSPSTDDGGEEGLASRIDWVATGTGVFYFQVRGFTGDSGQYRVTLEQTSAPPKNPFQLDLNGDGAFSARRH